ncbi:MAG: hypothetical protein JNM70_10350, partial [Anaerolineae bacterium]|nr:hypothetical protein [Anaerolineae bacterium]
VIRNLHITQSYHELARALAARTGRQANWCVYATWASKQAGQTIRKEDFQRMLEAVVLAAPAAQTVEDTVAAAQGLGSTQSAAEIQETLADVLNPLAALNRASDAVGRGNRKVYAEIGREFARFLEVCGADAAYDADRLAAFNDGLRPGDPPEGQAHLREAFQAIYRAFFESDPKTRAELLLFANIEIGFHEQTRLQPEIAEAMNAGFIDPRAFRARLIKALFPYRGWLARMRLFLLRLLDRPRPLDVALDSLLQEARRRARLLITEYMMCIELPGGGRLRLGEDVPGEFPEALRQIDLPELWALLARIDPTPDSTRDTGAVDWSRLDDRLHYIADLFRSTQAQADLFDPPFTPEQVAALKAGRRPDGRL